MLVLVLILLRSERVLLEIEDARAQDARALVSALQSPDSTTQRLAVRAIGRLERAELHSAVLPLLASKDAGVRKEAFTALGQMNAAAPDWRAFLDREEDGSTRGVIFETMGRLSPTDEALLRSGLRDRTPEGRVGAAKGLEILFRRTKTKPGLETVAALRAAIRENESPMLRELALLTLNAAGDSHAETLRQALQDPEPQVRRLALLGLKTWKGDDASYIVRYESLRVAGDCERARAALDDPSAHVRLLAIEKLGQAGCPTAPLERLVDEGSDWRSQTRPLVALAGSAPEAARARLPKVVSHAVWQARMYAARAAKTLKDAPALAKLRQDENPNVVAASLETPEQALFVLDTPHYGLLLDAVRLLKGWPEGEKAVPRLLSTFDRVSRERRATSRDPRREILARLAEFGDAKAAEALRPYLSDFDPVIAQEAARVISTKRGTPASARTTRMETAPLPPEEFMRRLSGARARVHMKGRGSFLLALLPDEAPVTVARFVELAERGYYDGLTFHRIVPNFVIQGGSPGANEYVGTDGYIRDEVGLLSHLRGTVGISTRGRDTGDCQIFINLVDNFRLDHNYTVFARVVEGMEVVDDIVEGDVIERIGIERRPSISELRRK